MQIVTFGTYDESAHPRIRVLIEGLRAHGHEVAEVNDPLGFGTADRVRALRSGFTAGAAAAKMLRSWVRLAIRWQERDSRADAVLIGHLGHFDIHLARWLGAGPPRILDLLILASDTVAERGTAPEGTRMHRLLRWLDRTAAKAADLIIADTAESAERVLAVTGTSRDRLVVCPVGADEAWFALGHSRRPADPAAPLRVCFFGTYSSLQGAPVVAAAAALLEGANIRFTMVGSGQERLEAERAAAGADVHWIDWLEPAALRECVAGHDVCLRIFGTTPKAARVVPTKVYQGAAAGCAIVCRSSSPVHAALEEAFLPVPPGDPHALASALRSLADQRERLGEAQVAASTRARARFRPAFVVEPLVAAIERSRKTSS